MALGYPALAELWGEEVLKEATFDLLWRREFLWDGFWFVSGSVGSFSGTTWKALEGDVLCEGMSYARTKQRSPIYGEEPL